MKKILYEIFIIYCLVSFIYSYCEVDDGEETVRIRDTEDCTKRTLSEIEQNDGGYKCCYMREKVETLTYNGKMYSCILLTQSEYKDIKNFIKNREKENGINDVKIDCISSYLHIGLIAFIFGLLFL